MSLRIKISGDHSAYHCGSAAAYRAIRREAERHGEVVAANQDFDLLLVNGEGSMHHESATGWRKLREIEAAIAQGKEAMLINTVWQANSPEAAAIAAMCKRVVVRETLSAAELREQGVAAEVAIDQAYHDEIDENAHYVDLHGGVAITDFYSREFRCFVIPNSTWAKQFHHLDMQAMSWSSLVKTLRTASLLLTGRHHAVYAACKARTPFLAMAGNTHKIEGLFKTASVELPLIAEFNKLRGAVVKNQIPEAACHRLFDWMAMQPPWRL